jgi:DNA repair photolyase
MPNSISLPHYYSPRISSELPDCSSPLTFDTYSRCSMHCSYCVPKGSGITMADGTIKKVEDVVVGDVLLGYNEETKLPEATVVLQCMNHEEDIYATFKFSDEGSFSTTLNHPIFTKEKGWIDARYVTKGMHVLRHNTFAKKPKKSRMVELIFSRDPAHRACRHRLYGVWNQMVQRCHYPNSHNFKYYGLRGIQVYQNWRYNPFTFYTWAENNGYAEGLEIDRIDTDGDYTPDNCRWVQHSVNSSNRNSSGKPNSTGYIGIVKYGDGYCHKSTRNSEHTYQLPEQAAIIDDRTNGGVHFPLIKHSEFRWEKITYIRTHYVKKHVYNFECWPNNDYCVQTKRNTRKFELNQGVVVSNCFSHSQKDINPGTKDAPLQGVHADKLFDVIDGKSKTKEGRLFYKHFYKNKFLFHWGGLADSFCHYERKFDMSYPILKGLLERQYPVMFSSKGPAITDDKYVQLFEKYAAQNTMAFQFSIVTADDKLAKQVEPGVPSPTERFEYMRVLSRLGYWVILRLRPFIIGVTDHTLPELLQKAYESGANAVSTEFYALDHRCVGSMKRATERMGKLMGIDNIFSYFSNLSPKERGGYCRLNRLIKEPYVKYMYKFCQERGILFACSDPDYKELSMSGNCCFEADTEVLIKKNVAPFIYKTTLKKLYELEAKRGQPFEVMYNGTWVPANTIRVPYHNRPWYTVTLRNGIKFTTTERHINLSLTGEVQSKDLTVGTFLQVVSKPMEFESNRGDYNTGWFVGIYLAEGSNALDSGPKCILTIKKDEVVLNKITSFIEKLGGYVPSKDKSDRGTHYWIQSSSYAVCALLNEFIEGSKANKKSLKNTCFSMSHSFREGLLAGWLAGDTGNSSSKQLILDMRDIAVSLGLPVNTHSYKRSNKVYNESNDTIYTLTIVNMHSRNSGIQKTTYKTDKIYRQTVHHINGLSYSQVIDVQIHKERRKRYAYCLKVPNVHRFQLANGLVTHNCGLPDHGNHPTPKMNNWSKHQLTHFLKEARRTYHKTGKPPELHFNEVYGKFDWILDEVELSHQDIGCTSYPYAMRKQLTLRHILQSKWNGLKSYANPRNYLHGKILPIGLEADGSNLVYRYNPQEWEKRWASEGIDLTL